MVFPSMLGGMMSPPGAPARNPPWEIEPPTVDLNTLTPEEIVREAKAAGELPIDFYRNRVPAEKRSKGLVHTLAYGISSLYGGNPSRIDNSAYEGPTPSNGETREMAMERAARMAGGYTPNGMPRASNISGGGSNAGSLDPNLSAIISQRGFDPATIPQVKIDQLQGILSGFRNPTGPSNPQTAADVAAVDARGQAYAQQISGHGGSSDFNPAGAYGQAEKSMGAGLPEDRRAQAQRLAMMSPSERALLASSPGPEPFRGGQPSETLMAVLGGGAAGPSGPQGQRGMSPEDAMARLNARKGGAITSRGYMPEWLANETAQRVADGGIATDEINKVADAANRGRGQVGGISPAFQKELDSRKQAAKDRGIARGMQRTGNIPPDIMQDHMMLNFMQKNPQVVTEMMRQHGNQMNPELLIKMMEMGQAQEEATNRNRLGGDAIKLQQLQSLLESGVPYEDAWGRVYGAAEAAGAPPIAGAAGAPSAPANVPTAFSRLPQRHRDALLAPEMDDQARHDYLRLQAGITDPQQQLQILEEIKPGGWGRTSYDPGGVGIGDFIAGTPFFLPLTAAYYGIQGAYGQVPRHPLMRVAPSLDPWAATGVAPAAP